ncbi:MAG: Asp-tRNA(Asn)/Glu-tRNA(Gln) amidotransferase subunit GatA [Bacteroidetes bacterium]|nr:Asp-tRNA(Asn)/Glu-tRNA(Gln) amidotransferase subunit GatA [Bacteroidota bacterium]
MEIDSLSNIREAIKEGVFSLPDLVDHYLATAEKHQDLNAYVSLFSAEAKERANNLQLAFETDPTAAGPLFGAVLSIKDNICLAGAEVTAASKILEGFESLYSATAVERLLEAGAIIIGRTNCDEFAMGSASEHSAYGPVKNADAPDHVPGGSSGGTAVSVQCGSCLIGLGSDTGGSVRQPASFCGLTGLKPTYGRISRHGLLAYASTFDQIGLIGRKAEDLALCLSVMAGPDEYDMTAAKEPLPASEIKKTAGSKRFCYFDFCVDHAGLQREVQDAFRRKLEALKKAGHIVEQVEFPWRDYLVPAYYVLTTAEASSNLSRYDGVRFGRRSPQAKTVEEVFDLSRTEGFGAEVKRRILLGTFVLSAGYYDAYYGRAQKVRRLISDHNQELFQKYDAILAPTSPILPWKHGDKDQDPISVYLADIYTVYANLTGIPAVSIPLERDSESGLAIGMQIMTNQFEEDTLFSLIALENNLPEK